MQDIYTYVHTHVYIKGISKRKYSIWKGFLLAVTFIMCHLNEVHILRHETESQTVLFGEASATSPM